MPQQASLFDRDLDERINGAKVAGLRAHDIPVYWIAVSPVECQALIEGVVSTEIMNQAATALTPGVEEDRWFE